MLALASIINGGANDELEQFCIVPVAPIGLLRELRW
jgi:hypothetical protein